MNDTYTNLYFNKNYDENILNISLIISDDQITHVEIDPNKSQDIEMICEDVCKKYKLESKIKKKLTKEINRRLNEFLSNKESKDKKKHKSNKNLVNQNLVERLYYESIEKNRKRTEFMNQIKSDYEIEEMSKFTFSPSINKRSNLLFKKNYSRVEDRLHYNQHKKKENSQMEFDFKDKTKNYSNNIVRTEENKIYSINNSINSKDRDKYFPFNIIKSKNKINTKNNFEIYNENYKDKDKDILSNNNKGDKTLRKKINKKIEEKEIEKRKNNINIRYNKLDFHTLDKERNKINKSNKTNEKYKSKSKSKNKDKNKIKDKDIIKDKDKNLYLNTNESNNNNIKNTKEIDLSHISPINIIKNVATIDESNDDSYICLKTQNNNFDKLNEKNDKIKKNINEDKDYQFIQKNISSTCVFNMNNFVNENNNNNHFKNNEKYNFKRNNYEDINIKNNLGKKYSLLGNNNSYIMERNSYSKRYSTVSAKYNQTGFFNLSSSKNNNKELNIKKIDNNLNQNQSNYIANNNSILNININQNPNPYIFTSLNQNDSTITGNINIINNNNLVDKITSFNPSNEKINKNLFPYTNEENLINTEEKDNKYNFNTNSSPKIKRNIFESPTIKKNSKKMFTINEDISYNQDLNFFKKNSKKEENSQVIFQGNSIKLKLSNNNIDINGNNNYSCNFLKRNSNSSVENKLINPVNKIIEESNDKERENSLGVVNNINNANNGNNNNNNRSSFKIQNTIKNTNYINNKNQEKKVANISIIKEKQLEKSNSTGKIKIQKNIYNGDKSYKDIFEYLYDIRLVDNENKKKFTDEVFSKIYTFRPKISTKSVTLSKRKIKENETKEDLFRRLTQSKILKNIRYNNNEILFKKSKEKKNFDLNNNKNTIKINTNTNTNTNTNLNTNDSNKQISNNSRATTERNVNINLNSNKKSSSLNIYRMMTNKEKRISKDIKNLSKNDFDDNNNIYNTNKNNNDKNYIEKYNENNFEISNSINTDENNNIDIYDNNNINYKDKKYDKDKNENFKLIKEKNKYNKNFEDKNINNNNYNKNFTLRGEILNEQNGTNKNSDSSFSLGKEYRYNDQDIFTKKDQNNPNYIYNNINNKVNIKNIKNDDENEININILNSNDFNLTNSNKETENSIIYIDNNYPITYETFETKCSQVNKKNVINKNYKEIKEKDKGNFPEKTNGTFIIHNNSYLETDPIGKNNNNNNYYNKEIKTNNSNTNNNDKKINLTRKRNDKTFREKKEENILYGKLNEIKNEKLQKEKVLQKKYNDQINKVRRDNIKQIFNILLHNNINISDLKNYGISNFMIQNLVQPVLMIIDRRKLVFNFENFNSLATEFLNRVF